MTEIFEIEDYWFDYDLFRQKMKRNVYISNMDIDRMLVTKLMENINKYTLKYSKRPYTIIVSKEIESMLMDTSMYHFNPVVGVIQNYDPNEPYNSGKINGFDIYSSLYLDRNKIIMTDRHVKNIQRFIKNYNRKLKLERVLK